MTDDAEREALAKLIYGAIAFHGGDPEHYEAMRDGIYHNAAAAILAKFMPAHDNRVRVEYETRRRPDPIHVDNIDGVNAEAWLAEHDAELAERVRAEQDTWREAAVVVLEQVKINGRPALEVIDVAAAVREVSDD